MVSTVYPVLEEPREESALIASGAQTSQRIQGSAQVLLGEKELGSLRGRLARDAVGTFALMIVTTILSFIISVLLARLLGATGYGVYAYTMAWVNLLSVPAILGLDRLLVREVAVYRTQSAWDLMRGLLRRADQVVLLVSLSLALLAAAIAWILAVRFDSQMLPAFWIALIVLPFTAFTRLRQAAMQGLRYVVAGQLPDMLIRPALFIVLVIGAYSLLGEHLSASWAIGINVLAVGVAFSFGMWLLHGALPQAVKEVAPAYQTRTWALSALPLLFIDSMQMINTQTDIVILGAVKGAEAAGIYTVINRGATLITFILQAVNVALAPTIASLYAEGDMERLQRIITKSARMVLGFSLPIASGLILFGYWFLLIFGQDFTVGKMALAILSTGQFINAAMGSVGLLLIMTGHGREAAMGVGISAVLNVILNLILVPRWGLEGAATATASSMIVWNLLLAVWVYKRLGIHSTALGRIG